MTAGELVTFGDLALLGDVDDHALVDTRAQFVFALFRVEDLDTNNGSLLTVRDLQRRVSNLTALLVEDGTEKTLFSRQLSLTLWRDFSHEDVTGANLGADTDDASLVQVRKKLRTNVWQVPGDLFLTELGVAGVHLILLDMNRGEGVVLHQVLAEDDCVFEVVALPGHERDQQVLTQRQLAVFGGGTIGNDLALFDSVTDRDEDAVVVVCALVGAIKLTQVVALCSASVEGDLTVVGRDL